MRNKWQGLAGPGSRIVDLGRPAVFLIPVKKLEKKINGVTVRQALHRFLIQHFGAYTASTLPSFGFWKSLSRATVNDACTHYEVSFLGKERLPALTAELARIAALIGEECIYLKAGQYTGLVYPR